MSKRPDIGFGMRHVALFVRDLPACENFYVNLLGMEVEWRPDPRNVYLTSGGDNLALHQAEPDQQRDEATDQCVRKLRRAGVRLGAFARRQLT